MLRTARAWGARPSQFLTQWSPRDRNLAVALTQYEASLTSHGIPASVAYDPESDGWLEAKPLVDYAVAAEERWRKDNPEPEPGTVLRIVDTRLEPDDEDEDDEG